MNSNPENPWSLILAHDEITPGNLLRPDNTRKFTSFYISFLEFGHQALRHEQCWFLVGVLRTKILQHVVGGFSCAAKKLLRALLVEAGSFTHGIMLPLSAGPTLLFAKLGVHLGDEAALSSLLCCKGASGIRPCTKCANVVKRDSGLAARSHRVVEVTCFEPVRFVRTDDNYVWSMHDRLAAMQENVTVGEFEKHQRAYGLSLNNDGVVADRELRAYVLPVTSMYFDWQHTFFQMVWLHKKSIVSWMHARPGAAEMFGPCWVISVERTGVFHVIITLEELPSFEFSTRAEKRLLATIGRARRPNF